MKTTKNKMALKYFLKTPIKLSSPYLQKIEINDKKNNSKKITEKKVKI